MGIAEHAAYQTQSDAENRGLVPSADSLVFLKSPTSTTNHDHDLNGWWTWWSRRIRTISGQFQRQIPRSWSVQFQDQEIVGCFASPPAMERADAFFWNGKHSLLPQFHVSLVCETSMPGFSPCHKNPPLHATRPSKERLVNNLRMTIPNIGINARRGAAVMEVGCIACIMLLLLRACWIGHLWWFRLRWNVQPSTSGSLRWLKDVEGGKGIEVPRLFVNSFDSFVFFHFVLFRRGSWCSCAPQWGLCWMSRRTCPKCCPGAGNDGDPCLFNRTKSADRLVG